MDHHSHSLGKKTRRNSVEMFTYAKQTNEPEIPEPTKNLHYIQDFYSLILSKAECIYVLECIIYYICTEKKKKTGLKAI